MKENTWEKTPPEDFQEAFWCIKCQKTSEKTSVEVFQVCLRSEKHTHPKAFKWLQDIEKLQGKNLKQQKQFSKSKNFKKQKDTK